ncbi:MAG: thiamine pyrophosphate-dependent enzyme [Pseudomonadota bacterium]
MSNFKLDVFKKASLCRSFENETFKKIQEKVIKFPVYLSAGQEYIASTIAQIVEEKNFQPDIFIQHRGHSTYLAFGGDVSQLVDELLGKKSGCAHGMGGSASIQCKEKNIYGHDGLMGSQGPIGVGACYASKKPTIIFTGDSAAEEDYFLAAIGWASTKNLPILFVVEDNNLSILTEKKVRRNWDMHAVAHGFKVEAYDISDDPIEIQKAMKNVFKHPLLLNINTVRKYWHAGAGIDGESFDRYEKEMSELGEEAKIIDVNNQKLVKDIWQKQLERQ